MTDQERQELQQWRAFGHNAFMVLFTATKEQPDHKWMNENGWMSSSALFSDLNNLLKIEPEESEAKKEENATLKWENEELREGYTSACTEIERLQALLTEKNP